MIYTRFCFVLLLALAGRSLLAQPVLAPPPLYLVTVDPETQMDCITWLPCPSPLINYYTIGVRIFTLPGEVDTYVPVMTGLMDTSWCNPNSESSTHPVGYTVWGVDDDGMGNKKISLFEKGDSTMFLQARLDTCNATITLNWNDYDSWLGGSLQRYNIYRRMGANNYLLISSTDTNSFVITNIQINQTYDLFVEAVHVDGIRKSTSNRVSVYTQMSPRPGFLNADYATISAGNTIDLEFTVDSTSSHDHFKLFRSNSPGGPFIMIDSVISQSARIPFADDIPFESGIYYYRLEVDNNCGSTSGQSNLANNIILKGVLSGNGIPLQWNGYLDWAGGVANYRIIRTSGRINPVTDTLSSGTDTIYTDNISALIDYTNPTSSFICYRVEATEQPNIYGVRGRSLSNQVCFSVVPDIRMPNAFIPNDPEPVNRVFEPVFSFLPESYELIIYNRLGTRIWDGKGPWDGRVGGKYVPEGVYLYYLQVHNDKNEITELSGKVTVLYR